MVHVYACEFAPVAEADSVIHAAFELQSMGEVILPLHFVCVCVFCCVFSDVGFENTKG